MDAVYGRGVLIFSGIPSPPVNVRERLEEFTMPDLGDTQLAWLDGSEVLNGLWRLC